jgi:hypothetical protein
MIIMFYEGMNKSACYQVWCGSRVLIVALSVKCNHLISIGLCEVRAAKGEHAVWVRD